jgi:hypothetical protein
MILLHAVIQCEVMTASTQTSGRKSVLAPSLYKKNKLGVAPIKK